MTARGFSGARADSSSDAHSPTEEFTGQINGHRDGHGFIVRDDGQADVYLASNEMRAVLHRDKVRARVVRLDRKGRPEGRVTEIVERPRGPIIGRLLQESGNWVVAPEDKRYGQDILIPKAATSTTDATKISGKVVVVELTEPPALYGQPVGRVTEVLGDVDDPGMEIEIAVRKYSVPHEFSPATLAQAKALPDKVLLKDQKGRVDLTDVPLVTIDGEDARDFDDAVYCEPMPDEGWRLIVAIADVSHYVQTGDALDTDAYDRATSVYFPRRVIPMLPEKLSNGLCSLNPELDRLCMVCDMVIGAGGDIEAYQFYPAVMHSHARLTYNEVAAILANTRGLEATKRRAAGFDPTPHLENLHDVFRALLQSREKRGAVDFETTETYIVCDEAGRIEKIVPRVRNDAHRLIEEAMLAANVCSADFLQRNEHPGLYRVHEGPTPEKKETLRQFLKALGVGMSISDDPTPGEFQAISKATKDRPDAQQIHTMLLRSMSQAIYTPTNSGHFGLAYGAYTHFTSPIRRYPDLLVHRAIKGVLSGKRYKLPTPPAPSETDLAFAQRMAGRKAALEKAQDRAQGRNKPARRNSHLPQTARIMDDEAIAWEAAGVHCSANERRADEASSDVTAWLKCQYMKEHLGEEFAGSVTAATSFGLFVVLDSMYVEGLIHISELGGDYWRFDEARQELRGERTGMRYSIGTRLQVQVSRVDLDGRKIDFRLIRDGERLGGPPRSEDEREGGIAKRAAKKSKSGVSPIAALKDSVRKAQKAQATRAVRKVGSSTKAKAVPKPGKSNAKKRR